MNSPFEYLVVIKSDPSADAMFKQNFPSFSTRGGDPFYGLYILICAKNKAILCIKTHKKGNRGKGKRLSNPKRGTKNTLFHSLLGKSNIGEITEVKSKSHTFELWANNSSPDIIHRKVCWYVIFFPYLGNIDSHDKALA